MNTETVEGGWSTHYLEAAGVSPSQRERITSILRLLPPGRIGTCLEIGARNSHITRLLAERCETVFALDLVEPQHRISNVINISGDICGSELRNAACTFDLVVCTEVLEHVDNVFLAALTIQRLTKGHALIGVPYHQDLRIGRLYCQGCGEVSNGWGHLRSFGVRKLDTLFEPMRRVRLDFVGTRTVRTTALAARLMELGRHPWGPYDQREPCPHCKAKMVAPEDRPLWRLASAALAARLNSVSSLGYRRHRWVHALYRKEEPQR